MGRTPHAAASARLLRSLVVESKETSEMPKVSRESAAHVENHGPVEDRHEDIDGYTVNFLTLGADDRRDARSSRGCRATAAPARTGATCSRARSPTASPTTRRSSRPATRSTCPRAHAARRGRDRVRAVQPEPRTARRHRRDDEERPGARHGLIAQGNGAAPERSLSLGRGPARTGCRSARPAATPRAPSA